MQSRLDASRPIETSSSIKAKVVPSCGPEIAIILGFIELTAMSTAVTSFRYLAYGKHQRISNDFAVHAGTIPHCRGVNTDSRSVNSDIPDAPLL